MVMANIAKCNRSPVANCVSTESRLERAGCPKDPALVLLSLVLLSNDEFVARACALTEIAYINLVATLFVEAGNTGVLIGSTPHLSIRANNDKRGVAFGQGGDAEIVKVVSKR